MTEKAKIARQKLIDHMEKTHGHDATTDFLRLFGTYESARNTETYELRTMVTKAKIALTRELT